MNAKKTAWFWIIFYVLFTLFLYVFKGVKLYDFAVYILILVIILLVTKRIRVPAASVWLFGIATLPHVIGMIPFEINGELISLYHHSNFVGNYDLMTHFVGLLFLTIGFLHFYYHYNPRLSRLTVFLLFFALIGFGTMIEVSEYVGYRFFGFGWGLFQFGEGDNSTNFGPWGDSITDTIANIAGISTGFISYFLFRIFYLKDKRILHKHNK